MRLSNNNSVFDSWRSRNPRPGVKTLEESNRPMAAGVRPITGSLLNYRSRHPLFRVAIIVAVFIGLVASSVAASAATWKFGVVADTQWTQKDDGRSPNSIPAGIVKQIHRQFIAQGVKLVVAVGDTVDRSTKDNIDAPCMCRTYTTLASASTHCEETMKRRRPDRMVPDRSFRSISTNPQRIE